MTTDTIEQETESVEELRTRLDLFQSWHDDDRRRIELLEQHLRAVLEIAGTWQPDYATKMDRDTIQFARECLEGPATEAEQANATSRPDSQSLVDNMCALSVWWSHNRARFTTPKQAAFAAWNDNFKRLRGA